MLAQSKPFNGKTVFINPVSDNRRFEDKPKSPNIPSLDPGKVQNGEIKSRAIGRKRNSYGKALGDILLKEGVTAQALTTASITQAFSESGYRVLTDKSEVTADTVMVDSVIDQFWSWFQPGFWAITLHAEIATDMTLKSASDVEQINVAVKATDNFQTAIEGNWMKVINDVLRLYVNELKANIR